MRCNPIPRSSRLLKQLESPPVIIECDMDDILELVRDLKRDREGQELLDEFVNYQTGKSKQPPRLLQLAMDDSSHASEELPFTEIVIGGDKQAQCTGRAA